MPPPFSMLKYQKEIDRLERAYNEHFNTLWNMLSKAKFSLTQRFFETIASRVKHVYDIANRDVESLAARGDVAARDRTSASTTCSCGAGSRASSESTSRAASSRTRIGELEQQHEAIAAQIAALMRAGRVDRSAGRRPATRCPSPRTPSAVRASRRVLGRPSCAAISALVFREQHFVRDSTWSGLTGMQSTGQTSTHCGVSKWPDALGAFRRDRSRRSPAPARSPRSGTPARRRRS